MKFLTFKRLVFVAMLASIAGVVVSGCSSSSTTPPVTNTIVTPKAGSTYTYHKHEVDSTSGSPSVATDSTVVAVVVSSGTTFDGKSNVVTLYDDFDTLRYVVESNNDISFYRVSFGSNGFTFNNPTPWLTLPFGSKKKDVPLFTSNDSISASGQKEYVTVVGTADYIGPDNIDTASGKKFVSGGQAKLTITITGTSPLPVTVTSTQTFSFDGSIGSYFHSIANTIFPDVKFLGTTILQGRTSFNEKILTQFNLIK